MQLFSDYHTHPQAHRLQKYSQELLQPWVDSARAKGLRDIAFTDHDRYRDGVDFDEIDRLRERNPDIQIRAGIELDNDPETGAGGLKWVEAHWDRLDFVLGSVHYLETGRMFDSVGEEGQFIGGDIDEIYAGYFARVRAMASTGLVDCLSHLDLIKIHGFRSRRAVAELVDSTLSLVRDRGLAIELSTAGWRKTVGEQYPSGEIIASAKRMGIPFTVASDAHSHVQQAENYPELAELMAGMGIDKVSIYSAHRREIMPLLAA